MELLREIRFGNWLLMIYDNGITLWRGQNTEFTTYVAFLAAAAVLLVLSVVLLWMPRFKWLPPLNPFYSLGIVSSVGGASMWLGTTTASRLSAVCLMLTILGLVMGAATYGVCLCLFRLFWQASPYERNSSPL